MLSTCMCLVLVQWVAAAAAGHLRRRSMLCWVEAFVDSHTAVALRVRGPILDILDILIFNMYI